MVSFTVTAILAATSATLPALPDIFLIISSRLPLTVHTILSNPSSSLGLPLNDGISHSEPVRSNSDIFFASVSVLSTFFDMMLLNTKLSATVPNKRIAELTRIMPTTPPTVLEVASFSAATTFANSST